MVYYKLLGSRFVYIYIFVLSVCSLMGVRYVDDMCSRECIENSLFCI